MTSMWATSTVGEQFDVQLGKMLDAAKNSGVPKPYIGNRAVQWRRIEVSAAGVVPMTPTDLQRYRLRYGDLLVCEGGEVGRGAIWRDELPECYFQKALHRLRAKSDYDTRLMLALLEYWSSVGAFTDYVTRTSIAHLPRNKFLQMPMPLPSVAEQRRIGDALQDADDLIASLAGLINKKQAIKQGIMQQLLTGRTQFPGFKETWIDTSIGELEVSGQLKLFRGKVISKRDISTHPGSYPIYSSSVHNEGLFGTYGRYMFDEELITWSVDGGGHFFYRPRHKFSVTNVCGYMRVTSKSIDPRFLAYQLQYLHAHLHFDYTLKAHPSVIRGAYNLTLPSLDEQRLIASALADADSEITALRCRLEKSLTLRQGIMQQLLTGRTRLPVGSAT